eukprot:scaffold3767_cov242-Prasinococcus_capsulatus_cf.AAC.7
MARARVRCGFLVVNVDHLQPSHVSSRSLCGPQPRAGPGFGARAPWGRQGEPCRKARSSERGGAPQGACPPA